ncbi:MerR family transcriptional regulator [Hymenobacter elongatus]|uniref:MerR family transcriptional regulator n=1 Tax=Hymenobacter elongatus TaxID=877208 RepID=A0A4Z0PHJ6_9BACT|nr:MerR family transcriptional regulator [Hymenobacter elongatus]TGE14627.1 MerR family transcriptional regulator [Hymenobacter elongatus]
MGQFSISDLENISGIKAHTIRMWEQRYSILQPVRTHTNIRTYSDDDLRRLLNVATLCGQGHRISKVARLSEQELGAAVIACHTDPHDYARQVNTLLAATLEMDEPQLNTLLNSAIKQLGFEEAIMQVGYPFLQRIGILWQAGSMNPAQEHLVTNLIRQKIIAATDTLTPVLPSKSRRWVLFLPEGELHELALLFMNYALRARAYHVLYLGQNMPQQELQAVCKVYQPHTVCTVLTAVPERSQVQAYINELAERCVGSTLVLYGSLMAAQDLVLPASVSNPRLMTDFLSFIETVSPSQKE